MIHPSTEIQILDVSSEESITASVKDIFQQYAHKAEIRLNESMILFKEDDHPVLIQDWTGWSKIMYIIKREKVKETWFEIIGENDKRLYVTHTELIPIYSESDKKRGFHGEVKYKYTLTSPSSIKDGDLMRMRRLKNPDDSLRQFSKISINEYDDNECTYLIRTKSSFFNANDFHVYGNGLVPLKDDEKWYK